MSLLYRWLTRLLRRVGPLLAADGTKLRRGFEGRADAHDALARWAETSRDPERPLAWFHAPSVGEGLQAHAVIEALRERVPGLQVVYTYFSPSAEPWAERIGADMAGYLPWDLPEVVGPTLEALEPELLVFTKTEVWPVLAAEAVRRALPVALVGGSVPPGSGRTRWPARSFLRPAWASLALACAIAEADAHGLRRLGVRPEALHTTGDPGIDSAVRRAVADPAAPHLAPFHAAPAPTVVAGSTWPSGEAVLIPAATELRGRDPELRLILAPHEPTPEHVEALAGRLVAAGWRPTTLSAVVERRAVGEHDAVVVDSVGVLAELYTVGDIAYVGGGFHDAGLHSVLEPAAAGLPVVFGPRHRNARAAQELLELSGAKIASDTAEMVRALGDWLTDPAAREAAAGRALDYIEAHRGAAARTADLLKTLI